MPSFRLSITLRGCTIEDPDDPDGIDCEIPIVSVTPRRVRIGSVDELADDELATPTRTRTGYDVVPDGPVTGLASPSADSNTFDFGRFLLLETILLGSDDNAEALYPYVYLMATYRDGSDHTAGELRRSALHATDEVGDNDYWVGRLPQLVVLEGEQLDLQPGDIGGEYELAPFRLLGRRGNG